MEDKKSSIVEKPENAENKVEKPENAENKAEKAKLTRAELAEKERKRKATESFKKEYFEYYDDRFIQGSDQSEFDIYVALQE